MLFRSWFLELYFVPHRVFLVSFAAPLHDLTTSRELDVVVLLEPFNESPQGAKRCRPPGRPGLNAQDQEPRRALTLAIEHIEFAIPDVRQAIRTSPHRVGIADISLVGSAGSERQLDDCSARTVEKAGQIVIEQAAVPRKIEF